jgi:hypothetical protein
MVQKRIRRTAIGVGVTAGVLLGTAIIFKKFNIGNQIISALGGFGKTAGMSITEPIRGLIEGVQIGGADIQEQVTGNRDAIGDWFSGVLSSFSGGGSVIPQAYGDMTDVLNELDRQQARPTSTAKQTDISLSLSKIFSDSAISNRLENTVLANSAAGRTNSRGTTRDTSAGGFGGFGSAEAQETALRKTIEESKAKYPQYFSS